MAHTSSFQKVWKIALLSGRFFQILWPSQNIRTLLWIQLKWNINSQLFWTNFRIDWLFNECRGEIFFLHDIIIGLIWKRLSLYLFQFEILSLMNLIFGLFKSGILQATQAVNIKFKLDKKSSLSNSIFQIGILPTSSADR